MKTLIVYYSRSGHARSVAKTLADRLKADLEEIIDMKDRRGLIGWLVSGRDAFLKKTTIIGNIKKNPNQYDQVIIGTPMWAGNMAPAIRTYLLANKDNFKYVALFLTKGGTKTKKLIADFEVTGGKKPLAVLDLTLKEVGTGELIVKAEEFIKKLL